MFKKHKQYYLSDLSWRRWRYKNTSLLLLGILVFVCLARTPAVDNLIVHVGNLGYLGAFITGIFFVSTFTAIPAGYMLYHLADYLNPGEVALLAGLGSVIGDYLIFRLFKDQIFHELAPIFQKLSHKTLRSLFKTPYFSWLLPVLGAVLIASPLPDELGVSLLGLSKIRKWQFLAVTYALNVAGIFAITSAAKLAT